MTKKQVTIDAVTLGEVIDMALSDHVSFAAIKDLFGFDEPQVKAIMRAHLRPARYRAWRRRVQTFGDRRDVYKSELSGRVAGSKFVDLLNEIDDAEQEPAARRSSPSKRSLAQP